MNKPRDDEQFADKARALFDTSVESLDAATLSRLNRSRQRALAEARRPGRQWWLWAPATGIAAAAVVGVLVLNGPGGTSDPHEQDP